jgi:hypothetical protein
MTELFVLKRKNAREVERIYDLLPVGGEGVTLAYLVCHTGFYMGRIRYALRVLRVEGYAVGEKRSVGPDGSKRVQMVWRRT